jgi:hypothetical protein
VKSALSILLLVFMIALAGRSIAQQCQPACVNTLSAQGQPPWVIQNQCCAYVQPMPVYGGSCATPYGQCPLMQPGPAGMGCFCPTQVGPVPGTIR